MGIEAEIDPVLPTQVGIHGSWAPLFLDRPGS